MTKKQEALEKTQHSPGPGGSPRRGGGSLGWNHLRGTAARPRPNRRMAGSGSAAHNQHPSAEASRQRPIPAGMVPRPPTTAHESRLSGNRWLPRTTCVGCAERSADSLTPSPPAKEKKSPARQDQAEQPATVPSGNGKVENRRTTRCRCKRQHIREHAQSHILHDPLLSGYATKEGLSGLHSETDTARARCHKPSGDLPLSSPPGEKTAARQDEGGQASTDHGTGNGRGECRITSRQDLEASAGASSECEVWPREARTRNRADGSV